MKIMTFHLVTILFWAITSTVAWAEMPLLPQTGQQSSYGGSDDGTLQKGVVWPTPRFTDNGNGTITDQLTALVWLKDANCFGLLSWTAALTVTTNLTGGACGLTDGSIAGAWRLPNRKELKSLINWQQSANSAWLNSMGFTNVLADYYWSSSTVANNPPAAWKQNLLNGYMSSDGKLNKAYLLPVR